MCRLIEKAASDTGISIESANTIFSLVTNHLINKVPELAQLVADVFEEIDAELLQQHVNRAAILIQQLQADKYKLWNLPVQQYSIIKNTSKGELF